MILALGISIHADPVTSAVVIGQSYEVDTDGNAIEMRWEMINETWETE